MFILVSLRTDIKLIFIGSVIINIRNNTEKILHDYAIYAHSCYRLAVTINCRQIKFLLVEKV